MSTSARVRAVRVTAVAATIAAMAGPVIGARQEKQETPKQPSKGVVIRGCLNKEKLSRIEPLNATPEVELKVPDVLRVTSIKVIKDQVKALNGHQVEVTGSLYGIPGIEKGILVADSDKGKLYLGGSEPDLRKDAPTIHAQTIKDIAATCPPQSK